MPKVGVMGLALSGMDVGLSRPKKRPVFVGETAL